MITDTHKILSLTLPRILYLAVGIVIGLSSHNVDAIENDLSCHTIQDNHQRLLCYDRHSQSAFEKISNDASDIEATDSILGERLQKEQMLNYNEFVITPHKPNYILPVTYNNNPNSELYNDLAPDDIQF